MANGDKDEKDEGGEEKGNITPQLLQYIFEPDEDRLSELTDMPLNQINPMTWMATFEDAEADLCARMIAVSNAKAEAVKEGKPIGKIGFQGVSLSRNWRKYYYKHRRSLEGAGLFRASQLANKQLETQEMAGAEGEQRDL